jgi:hypothetical protein
VVLLAVVWYFNPAYLVTTVLLLALVSFPHWFTAIVIAIRMRAFTKLNSDHGVEFPNADVEGRDMLKLYSNENARGRSLGAELSDLFWYFLCPGPELHQEQVENGLMYDVLSDATAKLLGSPASVLEEVGARHAEALFARQLPHNNSLMTCRLRDFYFPLMTTIMYELIFAEAIDSKTLNLLQSTGENVVNAIKFSSFRNMKLRNKTTEFLIAKLSNPATVLAAGDGVFDQRLTLREKALHLQGAFFVTGCVQMSEALAHTTLALAQHPEVCNKLFRLLQEDEKAAGQYLTLVIDEVLRVWPLFGIAHRITSAPITAPGGKVYPTGSVFCFNYPKFHHSGFDSPEEFKPERWLTLGKTKANYMPFGVMANRPCPAQRVSLILTKAIIRVAVLRATFFSSASHIRSLPCRGPSVLCARASAFLPSGARKPLPEVEATSPTAASPRLAAATLAKGPQTADVDAPTAARAILIRVLLFLLSLRDTWANSFNAITQLVVGSYMMWEHKKLKLCTGFFANPATSGRYDDLWLPGIGMTGEKAPEAFTGDVNRLRSRSRSSSAADRNAYLRKRSDSGAQQRPLGLSGVSDDLAA